MWLPGEGYQVDEIDSFPGQPALEVGSIIKSIAGLRLDDPSTEEEVERRFRTAFRDGAELVLARAVGGSAEGVVLEDVEVEIKLRVDPSAGAGLALVWIPPEGYLVEAIERFPGQPGLQPGDVLRVVGRERLGNRATEAEADRALVDVLRPGAAARLFRPRADPRLGDIVRCSPALGEAGRQPPPSPLWFSSVGVGTWSWGNDDFGPGGGWDALDSAFHSALDGGAFLFDTAPTYGGGAAEGKLGRLASCGRYALVATKYYPRPRDRDLKSAMVASARQSIARLCPPEGRLDLFQLHRVAEHPHSLEAQADALAGVVSAGLTRAVGVCNCSLDELKAIRTRLLEAHGVTLGTCQVELSLARQLPVSSGLVAACREMGIVVLAYSPLAMGRLTGRYDPLKGMAPKWGRDGSRPRPFGAGFDADPAALSRLLGALREIGARHNRSSTEVALNWVVCQGAIPLAGSRSQAQAKENIGAMGWRLAPAEVARLSALGAHGATSEFQHG